VRVAAGFGVLGARELPADTPCSSCFSRRTSSFSSSSFPVRRFFFFFFLPDHGNNFVKSARAAKERRRRNDCPTRRLYTFLLARPRPLPLRPNDLFLFPSRQPPPGFSLPSTGAAAHAPGVSFLSALRVRAPSSARLSSSLSPSPFFLLFSSSSRPLSRTRSISYSFLLRVPFCSLATFALFGRRIDASGHGGTLISFTRSLARSLTRSFVIIIVLAETSAHSGRLRELEIREMLRRKTYERKRYLERHSRRFSLPIFAKSRASRLELRLELTYLPQKRRVALFRQGETASCEMHPES